MDSPKNLAAWGDSRAHMNSRCNFTLVKPTFWQEVDDISASRITQTSCLVCERTLREGMRAISALMQSIMDIRTVCKLSLAALFLSAAYGLVCFCETLEC
ncbi:hypothetical protein CDAR_518131 [Caerostris darwini]|uniref:Uncharacterized protein n=1 Tax=Caerostris darwini TaxID=1538125 RepID=A0AAV4VH33_9ARAC|nr:hypothetical protein CDAR_518131 [Caerostris darwini]